MIADPEFVRYESILGEPNVFSIVGRSHYERWHSCFLGWLLDANGSHLLGQYPLRRFLLLLTSDRCRKPQPHVNSTLARILATADLQDIEVTPNENVPKEASITGVGRFDVFVAAQFTDYEGATGGLNCIIE